MNEETFEGIPLLEKEAAINPNKVTETFMPAFKNTFSKLKKSPSKGKTKGKKQTQDYTVTPGDAAVSKRDTKFYDSDEMKEKLRDINKQEGTGAITADATLGLTKKVAPKSKKPIENAVVNTKEKVDSALTQSGKVLAGNNPGSMRFKAFSSKTKQPVGEFTNKAGDTEQLTREVRKPSLVAPIQNTSKVVTPFLAAAYLGEKMYPVNENNAQNGSGTPYEYPEYQEQRAEPEDNLFDKSMVNNMDKQASLDKIAQLENDISEYAEKLSSMEMEKTAIHKYTEQLEEEKNGVVKHAEEVENNLHEKNAQYDEFRLRTLAKERSKVAVDLTNEMLENGLVKQADFNDTVDRVMDADEQTVKIYKNMTKQASNNEESLENFSFLSEYESNDRLATAPNDLAAHGLTKSGMSIGEAAKSLNK